MGSAPAEAGPAEAPVRTTLGVDTDATIFPFLEIVDPTAGVEAEPEP